VGVTEVILPVANGLETIPGSRLAIVFNSCVIHAKPIQCTHIMELSNPFAVFVNIRTRIKKYRVLMFLSFHHFFRGNTRPAR
jgi:hypothetical protein